MSRYYGLIAIRKTVCAETVIIKFVDCEWPMFVLPLILVVMHYILWFESLLILNNPVSDIFIFIINLFTRIKISKLNPIYLEYLIV